MRRFAIVLATLALSFAAGSAFAQDQAKKMTDTKTFVRMATSGNQFQIQSSKLALDKAQDKGLQKYAKQMIEDHTAVSDKMKKTLKQANIEMPENAQKLTENHQKMMDKLKQAEGKQFDEAYREAQIKAHDEAIKLHQAYAEGGDNKQLQQLAQSLLPTLKQHREMIDKVEAQAS